MANSEPVADGAPVAGWAPVIEDPAFERLLRPGAVLRRLATGATWAEGPVWLPHDGSVLWSDVVGDRVLRWYPDGSVSVFLDARRVRERAHAGPRRVDRRLLARPSAASNGSPWTGRPSRSWIATGACGSTRPNDVVVKSDGTIWFSDPPYGITSDREGHPAPSEIGDYLVFRFDPANGRARRP